MKTEKCKDCPFYRSFYHGGTQFSHECLFTLKEVEKVNGSECKKAQEERK